MATRASRNKRLIETRQSPIPFAGPQTPSPQSGTQVKTPEIQGLFNAPVNIEAQNTYKAMGNLGNTFSQAGQALQQRKIKARQLNTIDNRTHDFLLKAEEMDKRLHRMMVTRVFDPSRGEIGPERQRPKFQLDPSEYETEYKKGLKLLQEQAVDGLLDKDGMAIDPVVHRGISDSVNTYLRDKIPEMLSFATKMEIGKIEGDWERNIRDAMQAAQDGVLNIKAADTHLAKAYERGLELARTGAFPKGESEVRGRIAALAKEWMTSEVLDARSVEQLEGILKSEQYRWMPREEIESRIKTLKQEKRAIKIAEQEAWRFNRDRIKEDKEVSKDHVRTWLYQRVKAGEYLDPNTREAFVSDFFKAMSYGLVEDSDYRVWAKEFPKGEEYMGEVQNAVRGIIEKSPQHIFKKFGIESNLNITTEEKVRRLTDAVADVFRMVREGKAASGMVQSLQSNHGTTKQGGKDLIKLAVDPNNINLKMRKELNPLVRHDVLLHQESENRKLGEEIVKGKVKPASVEKQGIEPTPIKEKPKTKDAAFIEDETEELKPDKERITITFDELLKSKDFKYKATDWDNPRDINLSAQWMKQEINDGLITKYNVTDIPKDIDKAYPIKGKKKKKMSKAEDRLRTFLTKNQDVLNQLFDGNKQLESKVNELLNRGLWSEVLKLLKQELDDNTSYTFED
tara:strand:+ start:11205 stop:13247 length:2043 start_codon:yes stop_codon:yes gene_type:complete